MKTRHKRFVMRRVEGMMRLPLLLMGITCSIVGAFGVLLFAATGLWQGVWIMGPVMLFGVWSGLTGKGVLRVLSLL